MQLLPSSSPHTWCSRRCTCGGICQGSLFFLSPRVTRQSALALLCHLTDRAPGVASFRLCFPAASAADQMNALALFFRRTSTLLDSFLTNRRSLQKKKRFLLNQQLQMGGNQNLIGSLLPPNTGNRTDRMDGESMLFEWKNFHGHTRLQLLGEIWNMMEERKCEPEQFKDRITFKSMCNDIVGQEKETKRLVLRILSLCHNTQQDFLKGVGHSSDQVFKKKGTERTRSNQKDNGI